MKLLHLFAIAILLALGVVLGGCDSGDGGASNQQEVNKINEKLPPTEATPPPAPVREDGGGKLGGGKKGP